MSALRVFSGSLAGFLFVAMPISGYATSVSQIGMQKPAYLTGNPSLDKLLSDYESSVRNGGDTEKLKGFLRESQGFRNRQLSEPLRDELLKFRLDSVRKSDLSREIAGSSVPEVHKKDALWGLRSSLKKGESYRVYVRTGLSKESFSEAVSVFGKAEITFVSSQSGKDVYELVFPASWRYAKFLGAHLDSASVPESLVDGVEIVKPFLVEWLVSTGTYLKGEALSSMWGVSKIGALNYQYGLSLQPKVKVGVIDTGVSLSHPDLKPNVYVNPAEIAGNGVDDDKNGYVDDVNGFNFYARTPNADDDHGHGTHVAGVVGASVNGKGVFWVNSSASIVPMKVLSAQGYGSSYAVIDAINYAANNGIKVINMSLWGSGDPVNDSICQSISYAKSKGVLSVVAAGNENSDVSKKVPAGCVDALTVSAVDSALKKASFSNYDAKVDVAAPWVSIYSTYPGSRYATMAWTSMATPFVAGLASAAFAHSPNSSPDQIKVLLKDPANTVPVVSSVNIWRFVDMSKAMAALGVRDDSKYSTGQTDPETGTGNTSGTGSTWSWSTGTGSTGTWAAPAPNVPPVLSVGYSKIAVNAYLFTAMATDSDGAIVRYEFKNGASLVSSWSATSVQISISANSVVSVSAVDDDGGVSSKSFQLAYEAPAANKPPVTTASVSYPSSKLAYVSFWASDSDGKVAKIQLYLNGRLVYATTPNATRFNATLALTRGKPVAVRVVATDDKGLSSEKSVTVQ